MTDVEIVTERLVLRREAPGDRAAWSEHLNTPAVLAQLGGIRTESQIDRAFAAMAAPGVLPQLFIALRTDDSLVGKAGLYPIAETGAPDVLAGGVQVGWSLREDAWGRGYAREAAEALLAHGFGVLGLPRIWAQTSDSNARSTRLIARLGMRRREELDYADPDYPPADNPATVWSLDAGEWCARG